jgi:hypothetical protein
VRRKILRIQSLNTRESHSLTQKRFFPKGKNKSTNFSFVGTNGGPLFFSLEASPKACAAPPRRKKNTLSSLFVVRCFFFLYSFMWLSVTNKSLSFIMNEVGGLGLKKKSSTQVVKY